MLATEIANSEVDGSDLLISILLRYPEMASVKFRPDGQCLTLGFIYTGPNQPVAEHIMSALELFHSLEGREMQTCQIDYGFEAPYHVLRLTRDIHTLTSSELNLIGGLIRDKMSDGIYDPLPFAEDEAKMQDKIIDQMLKVLKEQQVQKSFTAVNEEGRILVYER